MPFEDGWSVNWFSGGVGGRYVAVEQRDRDRKITAWAVADTVTGKLVNLDGRGQPVDLAIERYSGDTAISRTTVVDAVGAESERYAWITAGAEHGQLTTPGSSRRVDSAGTAVQIDNRIVVLRKS